MAVETRRQLIAAVKFRYGPANDSPDFIPVLRKVRLANQPVRLVVADKGYDSERNHEYAWRSLGARAVMPLRWGGTPRIWIKGQYRRKQLKDFDTEAYHQRAIVETVHSVEKRKMGDIVLARGACQQHKELIFRAFAYNVWRLEAIFLSFIEGFYRALPCPPSWLWESGHHRYVVFHHKSNRGQHSLFRDFVLELSS